jgi:hypothetical protein
MRMDPKRSTPTGASFPYSKRRRHEAKSSGGTVVAGACMARSQWLPSAVAESSGRRSGGWAPSAATHGPTPSYSTSTGGGACEFRRGNEDGRLHHRRIKLHHHEWSKRREMQHTRESSVRMSGMCACSICAGTTIQNGWVFGCSIGEDFCGPF